MALNYLTLILDVTDGTGTPVTVGSAKLAPSAQVTDATDNLLVITAPVWASFQGAPSPSVRILATDNANLLPSGWAWTIGYQGVPGNPAAFNFFLPAGPQTFTATSASPCVFTGSGAGYLNNTGVQLSGGSLPAGFSAGTTYYVVNASGSTFQLAATVGGAALGSTSAGSGSVIAVQSYLSSLSPVSSVTTMQAYMPLPSGTPSSGQVPVATGAGEASAWGAQSGGFSNPMTTLGDLIYENSTPAAARLAGSTSATKNFLTQTGTGSVSAAPAWGTIASGDLPAATSGAQGAVQLAGDLGNTAASPQVVSTHLAAALPVNQGGTGSTTRNFAGLLTPAAVKTAAYTAAGGDFVPCDTATTGAFTVTLPTAPADLTVIGVKMIKQSGTNAVTVAAGGSDVFNIAAGAASLTLSLLNQGVLLQYKASSAIWYVFADDLPLSQLVQSANGGLEQVSTIAAASGATTLNLAAGNVFAVTLTGAVTFTFSGAASGAGCSFTLYLSQDATGGRVVTWPGSVSWIGGTAPVLSTSPNAFNLLVFSTINGGTTWYGSAVQELPALPLSVANGGTGDASLTAYAVLAGGTTGTGAVQQVSGVGTSGQVLTSNGAAALPTWQAASGGMTNPMTTLGDIIYENSTPAPARLAGSTSATKQFLTQTGTGSVSAAPAWGSIAAGDVPDLAYVDSVTAADSSITITGAADTPAVASVPAQLIQRMLCV